MVQSDHPKLAIRSTQLVTTSESEGAQDTSRKKLGEIVPTNKLKYLPRGTPEPAIREIRTAGNRVASTTRTQIIH
jgi:hypothetical protein